MSQIKNRLSVWDIQQLEAEGGNLEVEGGALVESEVGVTFLHLIVIQNLFLMLPPYVRANRLGSVFMDGVRYILQGSPDDVQRAFKPDLSFLRAGRIPQNFDFSGDFPGAPDLAVEVVSPGQTNRLLPKITHYLEAGSEEAWLIYPAHKSLYRYRFDADEPVNYRGGDTVEANALFPGWWLALPELFVTDVL